MKSKIRTRKLSDLQMAIEEQYEEAAYLLRMNEFNAEYCQTQVSSPSDNPGHIIIRWGNP